MFVDLDKSLAADSLMAFILLVVLDPLVSTLASVFDAIATMLGSVASTPAFKASVAFCLQILRHCQRTPLISASHMMIGAETTGPASAAPLPLFKACLTFSLWILTRCEWLTLLSTRGAFPYTLTTWSFSIAFLTHGRAKTTIC